MDFMLDTNAFNRALDAEVDPATLSHRGNLFVTHIQLNELQETRRGDRLTKLLAVFSAVDQEQIPTAAAVWDISEWDGAEWGGAAGAYGAMLQALNDRNYGKENNARDILMALTMLKRRYTFVTNDSDLTVVLRKFGGRAITFEEFMA